MYGRSKIHHPKKYAFEAIFTFRLILRMTASYLPTAPGQTATRRSSWHSRTLAVHPGSRFSVAICRSVNCGPTVHRSGAVVNATNKACGARWKHSGDKFQAGSSWAAIHTAGDRRRC